MHDLVIRDGMVVDGTGSAPRLADVAIDGGLISKVGAVEARGRREIDARGLLVTPVGWTSTPTTTARSPGTPTCRPPAGTG